MTKVQVFDPALCCETGICGPSVDPALVRFAADLDWLKKQGVSVERFGLSRQPAAFVADADVKAALDSLGDNALPLVKVGTEVKITGNYPARADLASWLGLAPVTPSLFTRAVEELVAVAAAIASNCESCFTYHAEKARGLGVSDEDLLQAVNTAQKVKDTPAKAVAKLAEKTLSPSAGEEFSLKVGASCCGPTANGTEPCC